MKRKITLVTGEKYHVFTKSIARFNIFRGNNDFLRMNKMLRFYQRNHPNIKFSWIDKLTEENFKEILNEGERLVFIHSYCIMPTHIHLLLSQALEDGIFKFMQNILNSYAKYFNTKHNRKGPLWESRFKNVTVESEEQYLHLTRYIHLNPTSAGIVSRPEEWEYSSYHEYISNMDFQNRLCIYNITPDFEPATYKTFVEAGIDNQRDLAIIKKLALE